MSDDLQWFHVTLGTYGSWLPGDPRGFRTRRHRLHVDGDYKTPPPQGKFDAILERSREQMKYDETLIATNGRPVVCNALRQNLEKQGSTVACLAIGGHHGHILCKLPPTEQWTWIGNAKRHAWYEWRTVAGNRKLWAKKGKSDPIKDRQHQLNVYYYILRHESEGAYVWKHSDSH